MTKNSPAGVGFKILTLAVALVGVFYFMNQLSPEKMSEPGVGEKNPLAMLFGSDMGRPMNWCPQDVQRLQVGASEPVEVNDQVQIQSYCQILAESFDSTGLDAQSFKPVLKAFGSSGKELIVEADASGKIFRFQGLPFGSKQLSRQLGQKIQR